MSPYAPTHQEDAMTTTTKPAPAPTTATQRLITQAALLGLRPTLGDVYRGSIRVFLSGNGEDSGFGGIFIGARTGRVLRGSLHLGNIDTRGKRYVGYRGVKTMLDDYAKLREVEGW